MKLNSILHLRITCSVLIAFVLEANAQEKQLNLALGAKVQVSSETTDYPASNMVDGKITRESKWMSATNKPPHFVEIDFEKYVNISEIQFHTGIPENERTITEKNQANGFWSVKNFKFQYWDDANWTDFPKTSVLENRLTSVVFTFENLISTFKIRMVADAGEKISIMEIEAFGSVAEDMPAPPNVGSDLIQQVEITEDQTINDDKNIEITTDWVNSKTKGVIDNKATNSTRGIASKQWPVEMILKGGYGVATIYAGDIAPDFKEGYKTGIQTLFPELMNRPDNLSTMGAWAWGLSRAMDYLETDSDINSKKVIALGTSRMGKAALWAGAIDDRFAMVISNESGAGGAKLYHHIYQEDIAQICRVFPHWFSANFKKFSKKDEDLPFDQHLMMSLIAPRPLLIASAKEAFVCDPYGEFLCALAVNPVYEFLGENSLPIKALPKENEPVFGTLGYYMRSGNHDVILYDWDQFIAFANFNLK